LASGLKSIAIPKNVKNIGDDTFRGCEMLECVMLNENLETISNAFNNCISLRKIIIPKNVKTIDKRAFIDCKNLKKIILTNKVNEDFMQKYEDKITYVNLDMLINSGTSFREANKILKNNGVNER